MADPRSRYSNPVIAQAFDNVASMFAPPSATDVYAYTRAAGEKQKQQRLSDVWARATAPGATIQGLDLPAIAAGLYAPNQSGYAVDTDASTKRRGQDLESGDRRYNTDVTARTSIANNQADNKRAMDVAMIAPVQQGGTRFVPPAIADQYGVPQTQVGVVELKPGEQSVLPDGRTLDGPAKPPTEDEVKARVFQTLPPKTQEAIVAGNVPIETIIMDGQPKTVSRPEVLSSGAPTVQKPGTVYNWRTPDGAKGGTAVVGPAGKLVDSQTQQELPPGVQVQAASAAQGKEGALGPTTANRTTANSKAAQLDEFDAALTGYENLLKGNPGIVGAPGAIRGVAQNAVSVVQEFSNAFGNVAPQAVITADQAKQLAATIGADHRDPAIAQARVFEADLAYKWAQMQNPTGEVSRQAFERALEAVTGGALRNNQSALESLAAMREVAKRARIGVNSLNNPGSTPVDSGRPAGPQVIETPKGRVTIEQVQ